MYARMYVRMCAWMCCTWQLDIPAFDYWPSVPFPKLKYPLSEHGAANKAEEARCLHVLEQTLKSHHVPVAAVIVEPVQGRD